MTTRIFTSYTYGLSCNSKYDDERVVNVPQNQSISCPLCLYLLHKPKALSQCGHTFCRSCIAQWFCVFRNCPLCRKSGSFSDLEDPPSELKATMRSLRIRCMHSDCNVVLSMGEMEKHEVKCSHQPSTFQSDNEQQSVTIDAEVTNESGGEDISNQNGIESPTNQFEEFEDNSSAYDSNYLDMENDLVYRIVRQATSRVFNSAEWNTLRFSSSLLESDRKAKAFWKVLTNEISEAYMKINDSLGHVLRDRQRLRTVEFMTRRLMRKWEQLIYRRSRLVRAKIRYKRLPATGFFRLTGSFSIY